MVDGMTVKVDDAQCCKCRYEKWIMDYLLFLPPLAGRLAPS